MKTLRETFPTELQEFDGKAAKFLDVLVKVQHTLADLDTGTWKSWPGTHKNVMFWVELENGYAVGWNESPSRGWSFPVIKR